MIDQDKLDRAKEHFERILRILGKKLSKGAEFSAPIDSGTGWAVDLQEGSIGITLSWLKPHLDPSDYFSIWYFSEDRTFDLNYYFWCTGRKSPRILNPVHRSEYSIEEIFEFKMKKMEELAITEKKARQLLLGKYGEKDSHNRDTSLNYKYED